MNGKRVGTDILAGLIFVAFGLAFAITSLTYEVGTLLRMGPGYFPLALGGVLVLLGLLIAGKGFAGKGFAAGRPAGDRPVSESVTETASKPVGGPGNGPGNGPVADAGAEERLDDIPWRAVGLLVLAVLFFGATVRGLGVVPATAISTFLTALASYRTSILAAVGIAAGLTVLCVVIFVFALQLRLPLVGPWLSFSS